MLVQETGFDENFLILGQLLLNVFRLLHVEVLSALLEPEESFIRWCEADAVLLGGWPAL